MKQRQYLNITSTLCIAAIISFVATSAQAGELAKWKNGAQVYQKICSYCHDSAIGPVIKGRQLPASYIKHVVRNGQQAMPAFRISDFDDSVLDDLANIITTSSVAKK